MSTLVLAGLAKSYRGIPALEGFGLTVPSGSRAAVVGPSGSGKTTLLRLVAGFEHPDRGRVELDGTVLADGPRSVPVHRRGIGIVAQDGALFPHLSLADNIGFGLKKGSAGRDALVASLMDTVELARAWRDKRPHELSGGQQQRVALARALALKPRLMLLDEPFSALDTGLRESTRRAVASVLGEAGITTVLVTHDQAEALSFADLVAVLRGGQLVQAGAPRDLYWRPADRDVALLLGDAVILPATIRDDVALCALGPVAVTDGPGRPAGPGRPSGELFVMLRPEQVRLADEGTPGAVAARLLVAEFGGGSTLATAEIPPGPSRPSGPTRITLRLPSPELPEAGSTIWLEVAGPGHLLPAGCPRQ